MFTDEAMSAVFHALAHESRRQILDILKASPGCPVGEIARQFDVSRIAVMNHLAVLEKAGLVTSEKRGRTRHLYLNAVPIRMIQERWMDDYSEQFAGRLTSLKQMAEAAVQQKDKDNG
ncbi:ArsR/SmtB family transcription factor [Hyphomonas johnsonii]|uniref:ArsR family transcriptional regulator n=1 Tax=Hyphomonas johnsonii MHS-2 TaxID=1280950 RepID=A0A059FQG1_9PROT|nr:metalloregulator ArsR/SmtB family transcription factor [Hyphomonas johnsonii]KCZ92852.1 ArsR family transcriptional regulator [Hyphomonas johnsonii MHS-2]